MPARLFREHARASDGRFGDKAGAKGDGKGTEKREGASGGGKGPAVSGSRAEGSSGTYQGRSPGNDPGVGRLKGAKIAKVPAPQAGREI
jgi:hypothetical protein